MLPASFMEDVRRRDLANCSARRNPLDWVRRGFKGKAGDKGHLKRLKQHVELVVIANNGLKRVTL